MIVPRDRRWLAQCCTLVIAGLAWLAGSATRVLTVSRSIHNGHAFLMLGGQWHRHSSSRRLAHIPVSALQPFETASASIVPGPPVDFYDGIDDLEEEEEEPMDVLEEEEEEEFDELAPIGELGDGIKELQSIVETWKAQGKRDINMTRTDQLQLHANLARDAYMCPTIAEIAWIAKVLEEIAIEDDDVMEDLAHMFIERADEFEPETLLQVAHAYGNIFWSGGAYTGDALLDVLTGTARRLLPDMTNAEVARVANALLRMGATEDKKYAGCLFEIHQRIYMEQIEDYLTQKVNRDNAAFANEAQLMAEAIKKLPKPPMRALRAKIERLAEEATITPEKQRQWMQEAYDKHMQEIESKWEREGFMASGAPTGGLAAEFMGLQRGDDAPSIGTSEDVADFRGIQRSKDESSVSISRKEDPDFVEDKIVSRPMKSLARGVKKPKSE